MRAVGHDPVEHPCEEAEAEGGSCREEENAEKAPEGGVGWPGWWG